MFVRPSKLAIKEGDFDKAIIVNKPVEPGGFGGVKVIIRSVPRGTNEVKISHNGHRVEKTEVRELRKTALERWSQGHL